MKPKIWPREAQESFLGEISLGESSSLEISRWSPRSGQDRAKKAFLVKSLAQRFQDKARDVAKIGSRKLSS